jgi:hypothetical protein
MIRGFTTVKFTIALILVSLIFYFSYSLISIWDDEKQLIQKIVAFLLLIVSMKAMIALDCPSTIKQFLLGGSFHVIQFRDTIKSGQLMNLTNYMK